MSFYRTLLTAVAALALATPVFADDTAAPAAATSDTSATATQQTAENSAMSSETKVNVNKATAKDLMKVKGLNAAKARAIVAYRKKHGDFKTLDDLSNVKGFKKMKPDMMKEIETQLTVE